MFVVGDDAGWSCVIAGRLVLFGLPNLSLSVFVVFGVVVVTAVALIIPAAGSCFCCFSWVAECGLNFSLLVVLFVVNVPMALLVSCIPSAAAAVLGSWSGCQCELASIGWVVGSVFLSKVVGNGCGNSISGSCFMCMSVMAMQEPAWAALAWLGSDITIGGCDCECSWCCCVVHSCDCFSVFFSI